jgi:Dolichyl-phosphate-mannose-protein mannosyltransferase
MTTTASTAPERSLKRYLLPAVLAALAGLALFVYFFRLGVPSWRGDEIDYRDSGRAYWMGEFSRNVENTFLAKYILGKAAELFGTGPLAVRVPTAAAGLLTGALLALLARRVAGWWGAALAFALWCFLPHPSIIGEIEVEPIKIERYARLDVWMGMFVAASLLAGWRWAESGRWRWAVLAGASAGLAAASKAPGVLVLPAVVVAGLMALGLSRRSLAQAGAVAGVAVLGVAATYLPAGGEAPDLIGKMLDAQRAHAFFGHRFVFDGEIYDRAPWWGNLWWQWKSLGTAAAISVAVSVVLAPFLLRRELVVLLLGTVLLFLAFFILRLEYALPHYYYDWQAPLALTVALVLYELARRGMATRALAAVLAIPLALAALATVRDVARVEPGDYAALKRALGDRLRGKTVVGWYSTELVVNVPGVKLAGDPTQVTDLGAIVDDASLSSRFSAPRITAFIRNHRSDLVLRRFDFVDVYLPRSAAARRRLIVDSDVRDATSRRASTIWRCLGRRGLRARVRPRAGASVAADISLRNGTRAVVSVEPTRSAAARTARAMGIYMEQSGGSASALGMVAVGYVEPARRSDVRDIETCVVASEP